MRLNLKLKPEGLRSTESGLWRGCALLSFMLCGCVAAAAQNTDNVALLSVNRAGAHAGDGRSAAPRASADGRFVVFQSGASDLTANDTNGATSDVFVRDVQQGTTALVSVNAAGTGSGNGSSSNASITPDGRFVVFESGASNLTADDANGAASDVFVRDLQQNTTTLVSVNQTGTGAGAGNSFGAAITPDGRYVVFTSQADDLVTGDANQSRADVFRRDLTTLTTVLVSANAAGTGSGNDDSAAAAVTPDGRYVLFLSTATDLVALTVSGNFGNVYRRDLQTNTTALVSVNRSGTGGGNAASYEPSFSDDGQVVAYTSRATDIGPSDNNETRTSVYARDFTSNTTALISQPKINLVGVPSASLPRVSADGRYVVYKAGYLEEDPDFNSGDADRDRVMRRDRQADTLARLPFVPTGICNGFNCRARIYELSVTPDGRYVAYPQYEYRRLFPHLPPVSWGVALVDASSGNSRVVADRSINAVNQSNSATAPSIGNLPPSLRLPFTSGVKHSDKDANESEDVYLYTGARESRFSVTRVINSVQEETNSSAVFGVLRNAVLMDQAASVNYATTGGTATAGLDYTAVSGTLTFAPGEVAKTFSVPILDDSLYELDETLTVTLSDPTPGDKVATPSSTTVNIFSGEAYGFAFSSTRFDASEAAGRATVTVELVGEPALTQAVRVSYETAFDPGTTPGRAGNRSDYNATFGHLDFAPGEKSKTFDVLINDDARVEGEESFTVLLSSPSPGLRTLVPSDVQVFIADDDTVPPASNPIDGSQYFVAQHYRDFLGRQPDAEGLQFWTDELNRLVAACANEPDAAARARCVLFARAQVSTAFFLSIEFQQTSYEVIRLYQVSFRRAPTLQEFIAGSLEISRDVVVGRPGWEATLEANKQRFADEWVTRPDFVSRYGSSSDDSYVTSLFFNGADDAFAEPALREALIRGLAPGASPQETRATVLRKVADSRSVYNRQYNPAFVLMQYYGYLRRAPSDPPDTGNTGYNFWLNKLNQFSLAGEDVTDPVTALDRIRRAQMVEAFLDSVEYRSRFAP